MTCHDAREQLSALLDEALTVAERAALERHLATCADCRRELEQLRGTVALLGRLGPIHAPAGFVDRVMTEAYRPSWIRRLLDALFRPLRVKLPLEAAAVLLVGISALYVYERTPEVRQLARQQTPAPAPPVAAPLAVPGMAAETPASDTEAASAKGALAEQERVREETPAASPPAAAPAPSSSAPAPPVASEGARSAPMTDQRSAATPSEKPAAQPDAKKEAQAEVRRDAFGAPQSPAKIEKLAKSQESAPSHDATTARTHAAAPPSESASAPAASAQAPGVPGNAGGVGGAAPATPARESSAADVAAKSRAAVAKLMRAADASGRLVVPAAEPAEIALDALLSRLGATRVARRIERTPGPILVDVNVPVARYPEMLEGLGRIGRWTTEHEVKNLPLQVRLEVAITIEP